MIGNGRQQHGILMVKGKVSYVPEKPFISHYGSIKSNILFGEPYHAERFEIVSRIVEL